MTGPRTPAGLRAVYQSAAELLRTATLETMEAIVSAPETVRGDALAARTALVALDACHGCRRDAIEGLDAICAASERTEGVQP